MLKILICDDEPKMLEDIAELTKESVSGAEIRTFQSGRELVKFLRGNTGADVLLLDIDMPDLSGLDVARLLSELPASPLLIFVTGHDELVYDSLQFHPFGFVRKSHLEPELSAVLSDAVREVNGREKHFHFRVAEGDVKLRLGEILYFESDGNYIRLFTEAEEYRFRETLASLENALSSAGFVRIHKGFLVNQAVVKMVNAEECVLENGAHLPMGRSYAEDARKKLMRYMLK